MYDETADPWVTPYARLYVLVTYIKDRPFHTISFTHLSLRQNLKDKGDEDVIMDEVIRLWSE